MLSNNKPSPENVANVPRSSLGGISDKYIPKTACLSKKKLRVLATQVICDLFERHNAMLAYGCYTGRKSNDKTSDE